MAVQAFPYFSLYCTGKAARDMMCQVLAKEEVFVKHHLYSLSQTKMTVDALYLRVQSFILFGLKPVCTLIDSHVLLSTLNMLKSFFCEDQKMSAQIKISLIFKVCCSATDLEFSLILILPIHVRQRKLVLDSTIVACKPA